MKLLHRAKPIGIITNVVPEDTGFAGDLELLPAAEPFKPLFDFLVDEERINEEPPFSEQILDGWSIEDDQGTNRPIWAPAIHDSYRLILWRW